MQSSVFAEIWNWTCNKLSTMIAEDRSWLTDQLVGVQIKNLESSVRTEIRD